MGLMIAGVGMFGVLSGIVASTLMGQRRKELEGKEEILGLLKKMDAKIEALKKDDQSEK